MTETEKQRKERLELNNGIDLRNMVNQRRMIHGQVVIDGDGESVIQKKMLHMMNRKDRRRLIHQDKIKRRQKK